MNPRNLYQRFFEVFKKRYPEKSGQQCQNEANAIWRNAKSDYSTAEFSSFIEEKIKSWNVEVTNNKMKSFSRFFSQVSTECLHLNSK